MARGLSLIRKEVRLTGSPKFEQQFIIHRQRTVVD